MLVAVTGGGGSIGRCVVPKLLENKDIRVRLLLRDLPDNHKLAKKYKKIYGDRVAVVRGGLFDPPACDELAKDADYVLHFAALIPPKSDHDEALAWQTNYDGTVQIVDSIINAGNTAKLVFFSSVAAYGDRGAAHHWGRVGDPLLPSVFDVYGASKVRAERYIMESGLKNWLILRESGVLYDNMMKNNLGDGLIFQSPVNMFIEWVSVNDTTRLLNSIVTEAADLPDFWNKVYNVGGGSGCRQTGYETYDDGFKLIGGSAKKVFEPRWHNQRNFHCFWFSDSDILEELFHFRREDCKSFWAQLAASNKLFALGKLVPAGLIKALVIKPLLKDPNAPAYWVSNNIEAKVIANFGGMEKYEKIPESWDQVDLICEHEGYEEMKVHKPEYDLSHGYDESKPDSELDLSDMQQAAAFRGGKVLSEKMDKGDLRTKLKWRCHNGHEFESSPYTILKAGHWCPECCSPKTEWNFDELSKHIPFYAQVWYDTHDKDEDYFYYFDDQGKPQVRKNGNN